MDVKPLSDVVFIKETETSTVTDTGLELVTKRKEDTRKGVVVAVGSGLLLGNGTVIPISVKVGDIVVFSYKRSAPLKIKDEDYIMVHDRDIIATIEEE